MNEHIELQMSPGKEEEELEPAVIKQMSRHADRLIALQPDNPASHEIMAYVVLIQQSQAASIDNILQAAKYDLVHLSADLDLLHCTFCDTLQNGR